MVIIEKMRRIKNTTIKMKIGAAILLLLLSVSAARLGDDGGRIERDVPPMWPIQFSVDFNETSILLTKKTTTGE